MKRYSHLFVAAMCTVSTSLSPAWADTNTASSSKSTKSTASASLLRTGPLAIAGFCAGVVIGMPICYVRKFPQSAVQGAHGLAGSFVNGDTDNKFLLVPAGALWLPCAAMVTLLEAPVYSWKDAWMAEKPFSKEQFSLGEMDAPDKK